MTCVGSSTYEKVMLWPKFFEISTWCRLSQQQRNPIKCLSLCDKSRAYSVAIFTTCGLSRPSHTSKCHHSISAFNRQGSAEHCCQSTRVNSRVGSRPELSDLSMCMEPCACLGGDDHKCGCQLRAQLCNLVVNPRRVCVVYETNLHKPLRSHP